MAVLKRLLEDMTKIEAVNSAIVVSRDGFVLEAAVNGDIDSEAVGAIVSTGIGTNVAIGRELNIGNLTQCMIEYDDGLIMMSLVSEDAILAVTATSEANLGNVRIKVKRMASEIGKAL